MTHGVSGGASEQGPGLDQTSLLHIHDGRVKRGPGGAILEDKNLDRARFLIEVPVLEIQTDAKGEIFGLKFISSRFRQTKPSPISLD